MNSLLAYLSYDSIENGNVYAALNFVMAVNMYEYTQIISLSDSPVGCTEIL